MSLFVGLFARIQYAVLKRVLAYQGKPITWLSTILERGLQYGLLVSEKVGWDDAVRFYHPAFREWLAKSDNDRIIGKWYPATQANSAERANETANGDFDPV